METEDFPDEFQCCVCLDIMYKPVVLACGHSSCFWCVFKAMDTFQESHCPVCRGSYNHFPRICRMLHFLLLKLYPSAYKKRGKLVAEEEKQDRHASSPMFEDELDSQFNEVHDVLEPSPVESNPQTATNAVEHEDTNGTCRQALATDLQCAVCKQLLCHPVVLNCGHVYCGSCVDNRQDGVYRCPECQSAHPRGLPNVCLVLEHFLEESFPKEYLARKESLASFQIGSSSTSLTEKQEDGANDSDALTKAYSSWRSGSGFNFHPGAGCDYCGMYPIIGKRYRCKDCTEKIGFDLCEGCYDSSSKLPGRFNQQHTQEHQFVLVRPPNIISSVGADQYIVGFVNPEEAILVGGLEDDVSEDEETENASHDSSAEGDDALEPDED